VPAAPRDIPKVARPDSEPPGRKTYVFQLLSDLDSPWASGPNGTLECLTPRESYRQRTEERGSRKRINAIVIIGKLHKISMLAARRSGPGAGRVTGGGMNRPTRIAPALPSPGEMGSVHACRLAGRWRL
jgi:hypothetical protein